MFCIDLLTFGPSGSASAISPSSPSFHIFSQLVKLLQESNSRTPLLAAPQEEVEVEEEMGEVKIDIPTQVKN